MAFKVLVVDDSALMRRLLTEILNRDPELEVVGVAHDPYMARERIKLLNPDVLTLDVDMPKMDGLTFLKNIMRLHPMPVVMVSAMTEKNAAVTMKALELGAVDFFTKPKLDISQSLQEQGELLIRKVKAAAKARVRIQQSFFARQRMRAGAATRSIDLEARPSSTPILGVSRIPGGKLIAIGSSTGGTEALKDVLSVLPSDAPPIVIAQHIPLAFSAPLAHRLNDLSTITVSEAQDGELVEPAHAYIAPASHHLSIEKVTAGQLRLRLSDGPKVNRHRPSVDVLFHSVAEVLASKAVGVILTGMGEDGARGLKAMRDRGASTIAQDEATSVVWGMPGKAVKLEAAERVLPIGRIAEAAYRLAKLF